MLGLSERFGTRRPRRPGIVRISALALACALMVISAFASRGWGSSGAKHSKVETFNGSCDFAGTVTFDPPLSGSIQPTHAVADLNGTCSGTLTRADGRAKRLDRARVRYHAESQGDQSCGTSVASGAGFLDFKQARIDFTLSETRVGTVAPLDINGRAGGSFSGTATASGDPVATAAACAGPGLGRANVTISGSTDPTISG